MSSEPFYIKKGSLYAIPITHYNMEMAIEVNRAFKAINPDCVAVELAETMELKLLHAASRLPDISVVLAQDKNEQPIYYLAEPCDAAFEALRLALENNIRAHCIDLDLDDYPEIYEPLPDTYSIKRIGLKAYWEVYQKIKKGQNPQDEMRELHMAKRLKELSLRYEKVFFVAGMAHIERILHYYSQNHFPEYAHAPRKNLEIATLTEDSLRSVMAESGWFSSHWEEARSLNEYPDRQKLNLMLYRNASFLYQETTGNLFASYNFRNMMKFTRNWALVTGNLLPDLFQLVTAAKGCVDSNYAYETWKLATEYPYFKNIDSLQELALTAEQVWGHSQRIRFHLKEPNPKSFNFQRRKKDRSQIKFDQPNPYSICSYPPEDLSIESFGEFLKKKGTQVLSEEGARTIPFSTSLEEGIDTRETIRHYAEKKLMVKTKGKPPGGVGSVVVIFDEDDKSSLDEEKYPWRTTWIGEHTQESDMAFYASAMSQNVVGPGISRCEYGGFMMSYPPRRLMDVWHDPDYYTIKSKAEILLVAAIDYSIKPTVVYVASKPPRSQIKSYAKRFGKKVVYIPLGQLSPVTLNKLRAFHVLDGRDKRDIADEYIF